MYYRLYRRPQDGVIQIVEIRPNDEYHYQQDRFLTNEQFATEADARAWLEHYLAPRAVTALNNLRYAVGHPECLLNGNLQIACMEADEVLRQAGVVQ